VKYMTTKRTQYKRAHIKYGECYVVPQRVTDGWIVPLFCDRAGRVGKPMNEANPPQRNLISPS
jgi:hypothetical protein